MNTKAVLAGLERSSLVAGLGLLCWWGVHAVEAGVYQARAASAFEASRAAAPGTAVAITDPVEMRAQVASTRIVGRVVIPVIGLSAIIAEGTEPSMLQVAVGHVRGTALPGAVGNVGLAGHRDTFFRRLGRVHRGDLIRISTVQGDFVYRVVRTSVVPPRRVDVLEDAGSPTLTLVTCYPFHGMGPAPNRFIVQAKRV